MNDPRLVILAGGISSRMKKSADAHREMDAVLTRQARENSKAMIGVGRGYRPFLDYLLINVCEAGYRDVVIVVGEGDNSILEYYGSSGARSAFRDLTISFAVQPIPPGRSKPLGTADALMHALHTASRWKGGSFAVCNSDNLYSVNALRALMATPHGNVLIDYDRRSLRFEQRRVEQFAVLRVDAHRHLCDIIEKPSPAEVESVRGPDGRVGVSMNLFRLRYDTILPLLESLPLHPMRQEKELPAAVLALLQTGGEVVVAIPFAEHVPDLTSAADIPEVQAYLSQSYPQ
jgi:NDP-sugar pyrophosphorylase family protein